MKTILFGAVFSTFASVAVAADIPAPVYKAPPVTAGGFKTNWSGPTGTISAGGVWGQSSQHDNGIPISSFCSIFPDQCTTADGSYNVSGALVGLGLGYNWQNGPYVFGVDTDFSKAWVDGSSGACGVNMIAHECGTKLSALATVRGKVGYAFDRYLVYVTGGAAMGRIGAYDSLFGVSGRKNVWGVVYGAGFAAMLSPSWSVQLDYLRVDFDDTAIFDIVPGVPERVDLQANVLRAGLTYHFNATPMAR
jgi:outer membrane immunogenic protein